MESNKLTKKDPAQISRFEHDELANAKRVVIVGSDIDLSSIQKNLEDQIKNINVNLMQQSSGSSDIKVVEIEKPILVPDIRIVEVEKTMLVPEFKIIEIEKPIIIKEVVIEEKEIPLVTEKVVTIEKPLFIEKMPKWAIIVMGIQLLTILLLSVKK